MGTQWPCAAVGTPRGAPRSAVCSSSGVSQGGRRPGPVIFTETTVGLHPIFLSPATDEFRIIGSFPHLESVTEFGNSLSRSNLDRCYSSSRSPTRTGQFWDGRSTAPANCGNIDSDACEKKQWHIAAILKELGAHISCTQIATVNQRHLSIAVKRIRTRTLVLNAGTFQKDALSFTLFGADCHIYGTCCNRSKSRKSDRCDV